MKAKKQLLLILSASAGMLLAGCGKTNITPAKSSTNPTPTASSTTPTPSSSEPTPSSSKHEHTLEKVHLVAPTTEKEGTSDYYRCTECDKILDSKGNELASVPTLAKISSEYAYETNVSLNKIVDGKITLFNDKSAIDKDQFTGSDYAVAFDAEGKIFYASRFLGNYGGPGDGFYHDGTYAAKAGEQCGIFDLDAQWAPWPAKATVDGQEVNAWNLFDVVVPENCYLAVGNQTVMVDFLSAISGVAVDTLSAETSNVTFEQTLADGSLNTTIALEAVEGDEEAALYVHDIKPETATVYYEGSQSGTMTASGEGDALVYTLDVSLKAWNDISLYTQDADGNKTYLNNTSTTFTGFFNASTDADWTSRLYINPKNANNFLTCFGGNYRLTYTPSKNTLEILATGLAISSTKQSTQYLGLSKDGQAHGAIATSQWESLTFTYYDASLNATVIDKNNTNLAGYFLQDKYGADWTVNLFNDNADTLTAWLTCQAGLVYDFTYVAGTEKGTLTAITNGMATVLGDGTTAFGYPSYEVYTMSVTLAKGGTVKVHYYASADGALSDTLLSYKTATVSGTILASDVHTGDDTKKLYQTEDAAGTWVAAADGTYTFVYTPAKGTLVVSAA